MSIIINIKPEAQAELTRQAAAHGVQLEDYAAALLEEAVHPGPRAKTLTTDQLDARCLSSRQRHSSAHQQER